MTDLKSPPIPTSPWQRFYGAVHQARERRYRKTAGRLPRPVVSIGNLHWGGSGKTPMTAAVASHFRDRGRRVAVLSRGYGSKGDGVRIVSRGDGPLLGPKVAGDEPVLLAGLLPGVAVVVCPDRYRAGTHALERLDPAPDLFVLDDGFSHLKLARDLDLLVFPAADPFAGGRLLPSGRLREPLASTRRAHVAVLSGTGTASRGSALAQALRPHGFTGPGFVSETVATPARAFAPGAPEPPAGARVLAVTGIARPERFFDTVQGQGFEIAERLTFSDHHRYPDASLGKIRRAFDACGAEWLLTTGKDRVKLQGRLDLPAAEIPLEARPDPELFQFLDAALARIESGGSP